MAAGQSRGMPDLDLTEEQIDALVAYLRDAGVAAAWRSSNDPPTPWRCPPARRPCTTPSACSPARAPRPGWRSWVSTVDHKKIGIMYGASALVFLVIGGIEALVIRSQLAAPGQKLLSADLYNQVFTMHGVTMIFLAVMPLGAAFMNYLIPLQIGARDVAFPRLNALSFWTFLVGGIFLNTSWFLGGGADGGWFAYAPNTGVTFSPSHGMDFYAIGLQITGIAVARRRREPGGHRAQPARAGHDAHADAGVHLDELRHPGPAGVRHAGDLGGAVPAHLRPALRRQLLQRQRRAPTRCCGSTCSGSSGTRRSTS